MLLLLVFAWAVALIARRGRVDAAGHGKAAGGARLVAVVSFLANVGDLDQAEGVKALSFLLSYVAVFLLITSTVESTAQAEKVIAWIVVGATIVAVASLYEGATEYNVFDHLDSWIPALDQLPREVWSATGRPTPRASVVPAPDRSRLCAGHVPCLSPSISRAGQHAGGGSTWAGARFLIAAGGCGDHLPHDRAHDGHHARRSLLLYRASAPAVLAATRRAPRGGPRRRARGDRRSVQVVLPGGGPRCLRDRQRRTARFGAPLRRRAGQELWTEKPLLGHGPGTEIVIDDPLVVSLGQLPPGDLLRQPVSEHARDGRDVGIACHGWFVWGAAIKTVGQRGERPAGRRSAGIAAGLPRRASPRDGVLRRVRVRTGDARLRRRGRSVACESPRGRRFCRRAKGREASGRSAWPFATSRAPRVKRVRAGPSSSSRSVAVAVWPAAGVALASVRVTSPRPDPSRRR